MKISSEKYKFIILGCSFCIFFVMLGMINSPSGLFIVPVCEEFGFSRSSFSFTLSLCTIGGMLINIFYGKIYNRFGLRKMICTGFISGIIGFLILWQAASLPAFYLGGALAGLAFGFNSTTTIALLINGWFTKKQGTILGICSAGSGLGGFIFSSLFVDIIATDGYRMAYLLTAICIAVLAIPIFLFVKENPTARTTNTPGHKIGGAGYFSGFKQLLAENTKARKIFISAFCLGLIIHATMIITPAHLENNGIDSVTAGTIYSAILFVMGATKIAMGWVNDRFGTNRAMAICIGCFLTGGLIMIFADNTAMAWLAAMIFGLSVSTESVMVPMVVKRILDEKQYSKYLGLYMAAVNAGITAGVPVANYSFDLFGSYVPVMILYLAIGTAVFYMVGSSLSTAKVKQRELAAETVIEAEPKAQFGELWTSRDVITK